MQLHEALKSLTSFDEGAQRAFSLAQEEAKLFRRDLLTPWDLFLGLMRSDDTAGIFADCEIDLQLARTAVKNAIGRGDNKREDDLPLPLNLAVLDIVSLAHEEAAAAGANKIAATHLLIGLVSANEPRAVTRAGEPTIQSMLRDLGADPLKLLQILRT